MTSFFKFIKPYLVEMIDTDKVKGALIFLLTIIIINVFDTNIESYDCTINEVYYDSSYLCVVNEYGNMINTLITMFDSDDTTELDEIIIIILIFLLGEIIMNLNSIIFFTLNHDKDMKIKPDITMLSIILAFLCSIPFIQNFYFYIIFLVIIITYCFSIFQCDKLRKIGIKHSNDEKI